jgi:carbonic anhydrase
VGFPDLLAQHFGVARGDLAAKAVTDPYTAVKVDVAALQANPNLRADFIVSGLVYDVATGRVEIVVSPAPLRPEGTASRDR